MTAVGRERLRVVFVDHCAQLSGAELALARLIAHLNGVDAHVVLGEDGPLVERLVDAGASVEVLDLGSLTTLQRDRVGGAGAFRSSRQALDAVSALRRRLRELRPDLVHTNSMKAHLYGGLAARFAGIPVLWHVRDRLSDDYLPANAARFMRTASRVVPNGLIANSEATRSTIPRAKRTWVVPSPIEIDVPVHQPDPDRPFTVIMVGRLAEWKGQHVFIEAFAQAFAGGPERALIVGAPLFGEHDYEAHLHEQVVALGLAGQVEMLGFRDDVPALLTRSDVLVHASVIPEPFGQVVPQGMAAGLALVASDAGGPAEIITDGVDGVLSPPGDAPALARTLRSLAADQARRTDLGSRARQTAQRYAGPMVAAQVHDVYRSMLGGLSPVPRKIQT